MCLHAFKGTESMGANWIAHVKKVYAAGKSKGMSYKQAMVEAKKTWKKGATAAKKGKTKEVEAVEEEEAPKKKRRRKKKLSEALP